SETMHHELLLPGDLDKNAVHFAQLAENSGADGVVCSVHEAKQIKTVCGSSFLSVTPGIRLEQSAQNDQKRIATPALPLGNSADMLVIGRSITQAENPHAAYEQAVKEWEDGVKPCACKRFISN